MSDTEEKKITILLSDIRGFSSIFDTCLAEDVVEMLNRYFGQMNEIIAQYEGVVDKYMGDSIMALFGLNEPHDDDLLRAVACAVEMQLAMDDVNRTNAEYGMPPLHMGIGINSGIVTTGLLGSYLHNEFTVIGDEVNLVSRIEAQTLRGQILISEKSYLEIKDFLEVGPPNKVRVKGKENLITMYEVLSIDWPIPMAVPRREVRTSPRVQLDLPFQFQVLEGKRVLLEVRTGRIKDMSYHGMFAQIPKIFPVPSEIKLSLSLSLLSGETRPIYGKIQIVRELEDCLGCGIEFTSMDQDSQDAIKSFIDRILDGA
jgi:adenylate cyclase